MPPGTSRRVARCIYSEKGRRCRKSGTGDPPICHAHRIVFAEAARKASPRQQEHRAAGASILDDLINGRIGLGDAFSQVVDEIANSVNEHVPNGPFKPPNGYTPPANWPGGFYNPPPPGGRPQPPPVDPRIAELARAKASAKQVLGFAPSEPVTVDQIKQRQRELARKHHPDRGGNVARMQAINAAVDVLLSDV